MYAVKKIVNGSVLIEIIEIINIINIKIYAGVVRNRVFTKLRALKPA